MITTPSRLPAGRTRRVLLDRLAGDSGVVIVDRGAGDRQSEFDGADDGVGNKKRRIGHRSLGRKYERVVTLIFAPGTPTSCGGVPRMGCCYRAGACTLKPEEPLIVPRKIW